jgi:hypothetical protein
MSGKTKTGKSRKHPGVKGRNPHLKEMRQREAAERQKAHDALSRKERLAKLDDRGLLATKERKKLENFTRKKGEAHE